MTKVKAIWGPHGVVRHPDRLVWKFSGARHNGAYARWHLAFWFDSRRFTTRPLLRHQGDTNRDMQIEAMPSFSGLPVIEGRMTDLLRARLKPEHIAEATRLALDFQRKRGQ
jgi:hypothetical protein